jgi:hypothetical protein
MGNDLALAIVQRNRNQGLSSLIAVRERGNSLPDYALPSVTKRLIANREFRVVS